MGEPPPPPTYFFDFIDIYVKEKEYRCTRSAKKSLQSSKTKSKIHCAIFSNHELREPARLGSALMQIKPISILNKGFQLSSVQGLPSKISPFLEFHIVQHAVIVISMKIALPKIVLVSIIMSRGVELDPSVFQDGSSRRD